MLKAEKMAAELTDDPNVGTMRLIPFWDRWGGRRHE
jgi:hypothetical protein